MAFRDFYDKDLNFFINKYSDYYDREYLIIKHAKADLRMYANLYNRDMNIKLIKEDSICNYCKSKKNLTIDHIKPISK